MNATHQNDVIFTRNSLNKFIKLIKTEGIKNLDYYLLSDDINVKNVLGYNEFSPTEKKLYNNHIAIVNKSYAWEDPFVSVSSTKAPSILQTNLTKGFFDFPENISVSATANQLQIKYPISDKDYNPIDEKNNNGSYDFYYMLKSDILQNVDSIKQFAALSGTTNSNLSFTPLEVNYATDQEKINLGNSITAATNLSTSATTYYKKIKPTEYIFNLGDSTTSTDGIIYKLLLNSNSATSQDDAELLKNAVLKEEIGEIEEGITTIAFPTANYSQIHYADATKHLLQNVKYVKGYTYTNKDQTAETYSLLYNKIIPVKSLDIRSWDSLSTTQNTLFPLITTNTIVQWQPSDLINLYSNYQIMKMKENELDDISISEAYYVSNTANNAHKLLSNTQWIYKVISSTAFNSSTTAKFESNTNIVDYYIPCTDSSAANSTNSIEYNNLYFQKQWYSTTSYDIATSNGLKINNMPTTGIYKVGSTSTTKITSCTHIIQIQDIALEFNNSKNGTIDIQSISSSTITNTSAKYTITSNFKMVYYLDNPFNNGEEFSSNKILVMPMNNICLEIANTIYSTTGLNRKNYGIFIPDQSNTNIYHLAGYWPQDKFWETSLLESGKINIWQQQLEDRLNNSINNYQADDSNNTAHTQLNKDKDIFNIVLRSNTSTTAQAIPTSINGFYNKDLGFYYKDPVPMSRYGTFKVSYTPQVVDLEQGTTHTLQNIEKVDLVLENIGKTTIYQSLNTTSVSHFAATWASNEYQYGTIKNDLYTNIDQNNPWANDINEYQLIEDLLPLSIDSSTSYTPPANGITSIFGNNLYVDKIGDKIIPIDFQGFINTPQYIEVNNNINEDNFGNYYILDNDDYILATEYDSTKTYYRLKLITEEYNNTSSILLKYDDQSNSWKNMTGNPPPDNPPFVLGNNFLIYSNILTEDINSVVFGDKELQVIEDLKELPIDLFTESQRQVLLLPVSFKSAIPNNKLSFSSTSTSEDNITTYSYIINWVEDQSDYCIYYKKDPYIFDYLEQVPPLTELDDNLTYYIVSTPSSTSAITLTDIFKDELGITNYFTNTTDEDNSTYGKKCNGTFNVKIELNDKMFDQDNKPQWVYKDMYPISSIQFSVVSNNTTNSRITSRLIPFVDYWTGTELQTFMQKSSYTHTNKSHRFWAFADNNGNIPTATNTAKLSFKIDANRIVYLKNYIDDNDTLIFDSVDSKAKLNLYYPQKLLNRSNALKKKDYVANKDLVHNNSDFTSFGIDSWYTQRNRNYSKLNNSLFFDTQYLRRFRIKDGSSANSVKYFSTSTTMNDVVPYISTWSTTSQNTISNFFTSSFTTNNACAIKLQEDDEKSWIYIGNKIPSTNNMSGDYYFICPETISVNGQKIYPIYIFTYDANGTLTNVNINPNTYYTQDGNDLKINTTSSTAISALCNSIDIANSDTFKKIYITYQENINLGQNNPYPGGPPVFFSDWSTLALSTTNNNVEDVVRDHYVYTLKLPSNLNIQDDDTYYGYPYYFDMMSTTASVFDSADEDNRYLLTYSLVKEHLPIFSDEEEQRLFSLDKTYTAKDFIDKIKLVLNNDNNLDEPYKNKEWHTYIEKSSNGLNITSKDDLTDNKIGNETLDSLIYHSGHINSSTTATYNKVVPIKSTTNNGNYKYEYKLGSIKKENGEIIIDYLVYKIESETQEEYPLFAAKNEPATQISDLATEQYIESTSITIPNDILQNIQLSIVIPSNEDNNLYIEDSSKNIGFRHTFLKIPDHQYTNSYTKEHPFPDINLTIDKDGKLVNKDGEDKSPNGTFSIDSGNEAPGTLVQIRGFNNNGDYIGDLDGSTLNNVNVGDGILVIHDESDAWRKPIIDKMRGQLNIAPEDEGGNIYASIVTAGGISAAKKIKGERLYGAIWNDYAEYRQTADIEPGRCVIETGNGDLVLSTKRLQGGANITSDTFGMGVGESSIAKTPIAVSGRVLAYPYEEKRTYEAGDAVCSGPNGTVSKMTREEIREWPDRIVGYVSEIPNYTIWGTGKVPVNGRIWIKVH